MYTEGDWVIYRDGDDEESCYYLIAGEGGRTNVALIRPNYLNKEANARLICQAPKLYEALESALPLAKYVLEKITGYISTEHIDVKVLINKMEQAIAPVERL